jgi:hypothetical protein
VREDLALVVARPARVQVTIAYGGFERLAMPLVERIDGLHVVVPIDQDSGRAGCPVPRAVDNRVARRLVDLDILHSDLAQLVRNPFRRALHIGGVVGQRWVGWGVIAYDLWAIARQIA